MSVCCCRIGDHTLSFSFIFASISSCACSRCIVYESDINCSITECEGQMSINWLWPTAIVDTILKCAQLDSKREKWRGRNRLYIRRWCNVNCFDCHPLLPFGVSGCRCVNIQPWLSAFHSLTAVSNVAVGCSMPFFNCSTYCLPCPTMPKFCAVATARRFSSNGDHSHE